MPRALSASVGGMIHHALNRNNRRAPVLQEPADYDAFAEAISDARRRLPLDILGYRRNNYLCPLFQSFLQKEETQDGATPLHS